MEPRNRFRESIPPAYVPGGPVRQIWLPYRPARLGIDSWALFLGRQTQILDFQIQFLGSRRSRLNYSIPRSPDWMPLPLDSVPPPLDSIPRPLDSISLPSDWSPCLGDSIFGLGTQGLDFQTQFQGLFLDSITRTPDTSSRHQGLLLQLLNIFSLCYVVKVPVLVKHRPWQRHHRGVDGGGGGGDDDHTVQERGNPPMPDGGGGGGFFTSLTFNH